MRAHAVITDGHAALVSAKRKYDTYVGSFDPSSHALIPFCVETFGRLSPHAGKLLAAAAAHQERVSSGAWPASRFMCIWRQSISMTVQNAVSVSVARAIAAARQAPDSTVAPAIGAYRSLRLLLRVPASPAGVDVDFT